ncbi:hypothetical protein [Cupriavidus sp. UME77]|uniref:hypothetical protein n=1 Tax=Cupriavidus sp. UME77 TaxID=1862321 RepID=UPI0016038099|nr:hypothetical protein [Cupriavidus sp. UME77]MBB1636092.1 hypothetical protein [Cupriavidus sp. UME77]
MNPSVYFDFAAALLASCSAACWARSARITVPTGWDADQADAFRKSAQWNSRGAALAAVSVVATAVKTALMARGLIQ